MPESDVQFSCIFREFSFTHLFACTVALSALFMYLYRNLYNVTIHCKITHAALGHDIPYNYVHVLTNSQFSSSPFCIFP